MDKKEKRRTIIWVIIFFILILVLGVLFAWSVARCIFFLNGKNRDAAIGAIVGFLSAFVSFVAIFFVLIVYPKITKRHGVFAVFLKRHFFFWLLLGAALMQIASGIESACVYGPDETGLSSLISLEWSMLGIAAALYALFHVSLTKKSTYLHSDVLNDQIIFTLVVFGFCFFLLSMTTSEFYLDRKIEVSTQIMANISFVLSEIAILHTLVDVVGSFLAERKLNSLSLDYDVEKRADSVNQPASKNGDDVGKAKK
ncbi:MAG: hypothetical protein K6B51_04385 [Bacilli bacterium]|nr:hypothetical protein [Bacilli bacterium]